ncbi:hypothetical protein Adt_41941 [Abeliophyllum distichum]|uniref:Uncharacterized protein n=1 Tax=Abeliophyllum distichum TaxID=126358 RepID=A0ABD1PQE5_9LAMI
MANTKGFDAESGPSTFPFEGGEAMDEDDDDDEDDAPLSSHPSDIPSSHMPLSSTSDFSFTEDHYNLLNDQIDAFTSTVDSLQNTVGGLQQSFNDLTLLLQQVLASQ